MPEDETVTSNSSTYGTPGAARATRTAPKESASSATVYSASSNDTVIAGPSCEITLTLTVALLVSCPVTAATVAVNVPLCVTSEEKV